MTSKMLEEALASADAVAAQLQRLGAPLANIAERLRRQPPQVALTIARGSSDHAASYFAYLAMQHVGIPVASLPMSVVTLLQAPLQVSGQVAFGFSQSGQSPDLVDSLRLLRERGALSLSLVNAENSPLEAACEFHVPLCAGPELSVAATKSFIATLSASAQLIGHWSQEADLLRSCRALPDELRAAAKQDWTPPSTWACSPVSPVA
ncbi:SIS domain-containing protein [Pseudomonas trivialis]|uniref:SIS domain-containing protein n=1 Tax=Pseudomonas trivialis TaxID=200450 RepID=A0ABY0TY22_9PSED|nr:SIS domain-containing protein [Pseudomonas trivialis]